MLPGMDSMKDAQLKQSWDSIPDGDLASRKQVLIQQSAGDLMAGINGTNDARDALWHCSGIGRRWHTFKAMV